MSRLLKFVAAVIGGLILLTALAIVSNMGLNNWRLRAFADQAYRVPLPVNAKIVSVDREVTLLGNGNHCDFRIVVTMSYTNLVTRDLVFANFRNYDFEPAYDDGTRYIDLDFSDTGSLLEVSYVDYGNPEGFDPRCS